MFLDWETHKPQRLAPSRGVITGPTTQSRCRLTSITRNHGARWCSHDLRETDRRPIAGRCIVWTFCYLSMKSYGFWLLRLYSIEWTERPTYVELSPWNTSNERKWMKSVLITSNIAYKIPTTLMVDLSRSTYHLICGVNCVGSDCVLLVIVVSDSIFTFF